MKKTLTTLILTGATLSSPVNANLIKNGDFSKGNTRWKGDKNIEVDSSDTQNKVCLIEVDKRKDSEFFQVIKSKNFKDLTVSYKVKKSDNYDGRGFEIRIIRDDNSYHFYTQDLPKGNGWETKSVTFKELRDSSKIQLKFIVRSGNAGSLSFDNVVATGK